VEVKETDRSLRTAEAQRVQRELQKVITDLKHENENLMDEKRNWQIREGNLKAEISNLLSTMEKRSDL
jgi:FtsZ-binding cell division protein ZapB